MRKSYFVFLIDILVVFVSFLICIWIKPGNSSNYFTQYLKQLFIFILIWGISSIFFKKYTSLFLYDSHDIIRNIIISNIFAFAIVTSVMYVSRISYFSRLIVVGTIGIASIIELILSALYFGFVRAENTNADEKEILVKADESHKKADDLVYKLKHRKRSAISLTSREKTLLVEISEEAFKYIFRYAKVESPETLIISTNSRFNIEMQAIPLFESIVNIERINDVRYINKFFETANSKLHSGGLFISYVETKDLRKKRILKKFPPVINYILYSFDFIIKRVFPKFYLTKKLYFFLTRGQNRVITKAEIYGRLYSCGFEIISEKLIQNHLYFVARKVKEPLFPETPSYGPLIKLERVGKEGKIISVYKMRTMHPYAEYLQEYVYEQVGLDNGGKFKNDFRVSSLGKIMRMFWIDELPMLVNLFKGDLKIVGVRPLSKHYFSLYSKELQNKRIKYKPGLVPPFYVDLPETLDEIMASELKYIESYEKRPFITDTKYFLKALYNIIIKTSRSK